MAQIAPGLTYKVDRILAEIQIWGCHKYNDIILEDTREMVLMKILSKSVINKLKSNSAFKHEHRH